MTYVWQKGDALAMYQGEGHTVFDTGMQLLTHCGKRVTLYGAVPDRRVWKPVDRAGCFDCVPSPLIEWLTI